MCSKFYTSNSMHINPQPQRKSVMQITLTAIKNLFLTVITISAVVASGELSYYWAKQVRGPGNADVGVVIYEHREWGILFWLIAFPALSFLFVFIIKNIFSKTSNLPYWIGIVLSIPCSLYFLYFLGW